MDMATAARTQRESVQRYERLLGNLGRMATRVEVDGVAGIMGGDVRSSN